MTTKQNLEEFVNNTLAEAPHKRDVYGYISLFSKEYPFLNLFLVYDGSDGEKYCGGHYHLNDTDMADVFSIFSNLKKKVIVNKERYYFE